MFNLPQRCLDFQHRKITTPQNQVITSFGFCPSPEWHEEDEACHCGSFFEFIEGGEA